MEQANEGWLRTVGKTSSTDKRAVVINGQWHRIHGAGDVDLCKRGHFIVPEEITMESVVACVQVFTDSVSSDIDSPALSIVPSVVWLGVRSAELAKAVLVNKSLLFPAYVDYSADKVTLIAYLVCQSRGRNYTITVKIEPLQHTDRLRLGNGLTKPEYY